MSQTFTPEALIRRVFEVTDAKDVEANVALVTDDVRLRFGNADVVEGKDAFREACVAFGASLTSVRHEISSLWVVDDSTVITEMTVHYERLDGGRLSLPCANIFRLRDGLVRDYRILMDISPVYA